jgi:hypothetical protein
MAKAEPNLAEVNKLISVGPDPDTVSETIDVKYALSVLRSENASLKDSARMNAEREALNVGTYKRNQEHLQQANLKLQEQLLAAQERVFELQNKLLSLREIVNSA